MNLRDGYGKSFIVLLSYENRAAGQDETSLILDYDRMMSQNEPSDRQVPDPGTELDLQDRQKMLCGHRL